MSAPKTIGAALSAAAATASPPTIHPDHLNCRGCEHFQEDNMKMVCVNLFWFDGGAPADPPCYEYPPAFLDAVRAHLKLVETLGEDHPETLSSMMVSIELAPVPMREKFERFAVESGALPEASGYLDDGSKVFSLEAIAKHTGLSVEQVQADLSKLQAERRMIGLPEFHAPEASAIHHRQ